MTEFTFFSLQPQANGGAGARSSNGGSKPGAERAVDGSELQSMIGANGGANGGPSSSAAAAAGAPFNGGCGPPAEAAC